jgi:hypothetical protein
MRAIQLFILAGVLLVAGVVSIASGWHGNAGVNLGMPVTATSVSFSGSANGASALVGILTIIPGVIIFIIAVIMALVRMADRPRTT